MMKRVMCAALAALTTACTSPLQVEVSNPTQTDRSNETVEIAWSEIASLRGATPETVVVLDPQGEQIPSQVLYLGTDEPQALIFQAAAGAGATVRYTVGTGQRAAYASKAYGRQVPERYDDYAWENDKVAYRLYGPALETSPERLITPGIDVWVKSTDRLVVDERYARGHYHENHGDGMDCYKVGVTLGAGASLPYVGGRLRMMGHNYAACRTLDNGPIRTTVELTYAPFEVDGAEVSLVKTVSLDAGSRFNRMENRYIGADLPIAAGVVRHEVKQFAQGDGWLALCEAASDSKDPARDGDIYLGIVLPEAEILPEAEGHALAVREARSNEPLVYYAGSGWSQGGVENMDRWVEEVEMQRAAIAAPLEIRIVR